jgi:flavin-dependent dehydrogenase
VSGPVIVGGGLAGGAAATLLARSGQRPLLLEKSAGPHDKICGEFLSTEAQAHLAALGFDVGRLGGAPIDRLRLVARTRTVETRLPFRAVGVTRRLLDEALLEHAAAAGAKVERGVTVRSIDGTTLESSAGAMTATTLLLASGKHDVRGAKRDTAGTLDGLIGFKQYFRVPASVRAALAGHIEVVLFDGGYAGLQLVEGGVANLCLLVERAAYDAGRGWDGLFARLLAEPHLRARLGDANALLDRPLTISGVPYGFVARAGGPAFRLGDQAGVIPSFSGDGMSIALHSARLAARAVADGADAQAYAKAFRRDCAAQIARATWLQRAGWSPAGRAALVTGLSLAPRAMALAATWTRVSPPALARAGVA